MTSLVPPRIRQRQPQAASHIESDSVQGLTRETPVFLNSPSFLVITVRRRLSAAAAIIASGRCPSRGSPRCRLVSMILAHACAPSSVQSNTRPSAKSSSQLIQYPVAVLRADYVIQIPKTFVNLEALPLCIDGMSQHGSGLRLQVRSRTRSQPVVIRLGPIERSGHVSVVPSRNLSASPPYRHARSSPAHSRSGRPPSPVEHRPDAPARGKRNRRPVGRVLPDRRTASTQTVSSELQ